MKYTITKETLAALADARKLQVLKLHERHPGKTPKGHIGYDDKIASITFNNGCGPQTKLLPIHTMAAWAKSIDGDSLGLTVTEENGVKLLGNDRGTRCFAHFIEYENAELLEPLQIEAHEPEMIFTFRPPDQSETKTIKAEVSERRKKERAQAEFDRAREKFTKQHALLRSFAQRRRESLKALKIDRSFVVARARRIRAAKSLVRRFIRPLERPEPKYGVLNRLPLWMDCESARSVKASLIACKCAETAVKAEVARLAKRGEHRFKPDVSSRKFRPKTKFDRLFAELHAARRSLVSAVRLALEAHFAGLGFHYAHNLSYGHYYQDALARHIDARRFVREWEGIVCKERLAFNELFHRVRAARKAWQKLH